MRILPISLALKVLKGQTFGGRLKSVTKEQARTWLRNVSGLDFGYDAKAWSNWLKENRWAFNRFPFSPLEPSERGPKKKTKGPKSERNRWTKFIDKA
jgi:hypothetical protein